MTMYAIRTDYRHLQRIVLECDNCGLQACYEHSDRYCKPLGFYARSDLWKYEYRSAGRRYPKTRHFCKSCERPRKDKLSNEHPRISWA